MRQLFKRSARDLLEPSPSHTNTWCATAGHKSKRSPLLPVCGQMQHWPPPYVWRTRVCLKVFSALNQLLDFPSYTVFRLFIKSYRRFCHQLKLTVSFWISAYNHLWILNQPASLACRKCCVQFPLNCGSSKGISLISNQSCCELWVYPLLCTIHL